MDQAQPLVIFSEVVDGEVLPMLTICASAQEVASYGRAVGSFPEGDSVPPTLLLAFAMAEMTAVMPLPPSTLHVGQELTLRRAVCIGEHLEARFVFRNRRRSSGNTLHRFDLMIFSDQEIVADGRIGLQTA
jgi:hypothetical protein